MNALVGAHVCPVDGDIATSVPTLVRFAPEPEATAWVEPDSDTDLDGDREPIRVEISPERVADWVSEISNPGNERRARYVEVGLPRTILERGVSLVDTPGVGGLSSLHAARTMAILSSADAVLFVTDASQEFSEPELRFLRRARDLCPTLACVVTKIDLYPEWRKVVGLDEDHLARLRLPVPVLPVSSPLRWAAVESGDDDLNQESQFPGVVGFLREEVLEPAERTAVRAAMDDVLAVASELRKQFETEREALTDPRAAAVTAKDLESARARAAQLRTGAARWQITMNDGVTDIGSDVDHDFRNRLRRLTEEAESRIDAEDPAEWWAEFKGQLEERVNDEVVANYQMLLQRIDELALDVAEHFAEDEEEARGMAGDADVAAPTELLDGLKGPASSLDERRSGVSAVASTVANKSLSAVKATYGGFLMFSMVGGMIGLGPLSPAVIGLTLLLGRKSMKEEKQRQLAARRQEAKVAVRKFIDEVSFQVGKDSRDTLRRVHRVLRDTFSARAEELQASLNERLKVAQQASDTGEDDRAGRLRAVDAEIGRIAELSRRAETLAGDQRPGVGL